MAFLGHPVELVGSIRVSSLRRIKEYIESQILPRISSSNIAYYFAVNLNAATQLFSPAHHCTKVTTSPNELSNQSERFAEDNNKESGNFTCNFCILF